MPGSFVANGNIAACSFVKFDGTRPGLVVQAGAGDAVVGVAGQGSRWAPWDELDDGYLAVAGENVAVKQDGAKRVMIKLGGTVDEGSWLKSDASGFAVASTTDQDKVGGRARQAGVSGDYIEMDVIIGERSTA